MGTESAIRGVVSGIDLMIGDKKIIGRPTSPDD